MRPRCASCNTRENAATLPTSLEATKNCSRSRWRTKTASGWLRNTTRCIDTYDANVAPRRLVRVGTKKLASSKEKASAREVRPSIRRSNHSTRLPGQIKKYQNLRRQGRDTVQHDIADGAGSRGDESLMPFIQTRHQGRHEESDRGPTQRPSRSPRQTQ